MKGLRPEGLRPESLRLKSLRPAVLVVDVSADLSLATRAMEAALVTARATQGRAEMLLALCKASPELLDKARGILRAGGGASAETAGCPRQESLTARGSVLRDCCHWS